MNPTPRAAAQLSAVVCALLGWALILSACGDDGPAAAEQGGATRIERQASSPPAGDRCRVQLRGFLGALDELRGRLAVGLTYETYYGEVRGVRATYGKIAAGRLGIGCLLAVGTPAERALDEYIDAANSWGDCAADVSCTLESVEAELQRRWRLASDLLSAAQAGLRGMRAR